MKEKLDPLDKVSQGLEITINWLVALLMFVAGLLVSIEIFFRYVLGKPSDYGDELVLYLSLTAALLGAALASKHTRHTEIDILPRMVRNAKIKILIEVVNYSATILACILLAVAGFLHSLNLKGLQLSTPSTLAIPLWLVNVILPIGLILCCFFTVERLKKLFDRSGNPTDQ